MPAKGNGPSATPKAGAEGTGLTEAGVVLDPFSPRLSFVDRVADPKIRTWYDRSTIEPVKALDKNVMARMDLEAIVAHSAWDGLVKQPKPQPEDAYPSELEERLGDRERQFILRNLSRVEKMVDPDEPLPFSEETLDVPDVDALLAEARDFHHEAPQFIAEFNIEAMKRDLAWRREYHREIDWTRHFGAEVRKNHTGPMWSYDPDAAEAEAAAAAAAQAEIEGTQPPSEEPDESAV